MAKQRDDNTTGRMLFTDFDASAKGRPVATFESGSPAPAFPFLNQPIPTIEELASSLGLDFEDDWGATPDDIAPAPPPAKTGTAARTRQPAHEPVPPTGIPTWEEYTKSFRQAAPSTVSLWDEPEETPPPPPESPDVLAADEDSDFDILSSLPPGEALGDEETDPVHKPFEGAWRGERLGVEPPREHPYGGITRLEEWYRPPEEESPPETPEQVRDWYEPPTSVTSATRAERRSSSTTQGLDMFSDLDLDALWEDKLREAREGRNQTSRIMNPAQDIFDDIDLDAIWEEKQRRQRSETAAPGASATRIRPPDTPRARDANSTMILGDGVLDKASTIVMEPRGMPASPPSPAPASGHGRSERREQPRTRKRSKRKTPPAGADGDIGFLEDEERVHEEPTASASPSGAGVRVQAPSTIEELDINHLISDEALWPDADDSVAAPVIGDDAIQPIGGRARRNKTRSDPSGPAAASPSEPVPAADDAIWDSLDEEDAGRADVKAPDIDFGALVRKPRTARRKSAGDEGDEEAVVDASTAESESMFGDADPDYDDYMPAVNADVAAPVIGDDAIEAIAPSKRKRRDPEEEEAVSDDAVAADIAADDVDDADIGLDAADDVFAGLADGGEEAAEEGGEGEEAVAVDPMDVFSNMEDMDFSDDDGMDDEMKALLAEDAEEAGEGVEDAAGAPIGGPPEAPPSGLKNKILYYVRKYVTGLAPRALLHRITGMVAWRENWWFYLDLLAAVITSASLAVIISYFLWYRK